MEKDTSEKVTDSFDVVTAAEKQKSMENIDS